jgi:hypothetical protein
MMTLFAFGCSSSSTPPSEGDDDGTGNTGGSIGAGGASDAGKGTGGKAAADASKDTGGTGGKSGGSGGSVGAGGEEPLTPPPLNHVDPTEPLVRSSVGLQRRGRSAMPAGLRNRRPGQ